MKNNISIPEKTLKRLSHYHFYLRQLLKHKRDFVSNERLAIDLNISISDIRDDLDNLNTSLSVSDIHEVRRLVTIVEQYLGYNQSNTAVLVGVGKIGKAILKYKGFQDYNLEILAVFDKQENLVGSSINGIEVFDVIKMVELVERLKVHIGIIATPPESAQLVADVLINSGVKGIWNFSEAIIKVPEPVKLQNTSLYNDYLMLLDKIKNTDHHKT